MSQDLPNLHGLLTLSRRDGIDVRPTLLRVLTDLYVQEPNHSSEERRRFAELAGRMLDKADDDTKKAVAEKLATTADAPADVIMRLANEPPAISAPVLQHSPVLSEDDLLVLLETHKTTHAAPIARRKNLTARLGRRLSALTSDGLNRALDMLDNFTTQLNADPLAPPVAEAPAHYPGIVPESPIEVRLEPIVEAPPTQPAVRDEQMVDPVAFAAMLLSRDDVPEADLAPALLLAAPEQRRRILAALAKGQRPEMEPLSPVVMADVSRRLQGAALGQRRGEFALTLERALGLPQKIVRDILADVDGEGLMIALKAIGIGADVTLRILLFLDPAMGRSVEKVFTLTAFYEDLDARIARRMIAVWRGVFTPSLAARLAAPATHVPQSMPSRQEQPAARTEATNARYANAIADQARIGVSVNLPPRRMLISPAWVAKATAKPQG